MSALLDRANLLLEQSRPAEAEDYARRAIEEDPESYRGYLILVYALADQDKDASSVEAAKQVVSLEPEIALSHYALGYALYSNSEYKQAEASFETARSLDAEDPDTLGFLALLKARKSKWEESLELANLGLRIDSENTICVNARSNALLKLKRGGEAKETVDYAMNQDPENAYVHLQKGQYHLESGEYKESAESYIEALRLEPGLEPAKAGLVQALKGQYKIYSLFLRYVFFMGRLSPRMQWGVMIGGYFAFRVTRESAQQSGQWALSYVVTGLWLGFVLFSWTAHSLFNLLLFVHPLGRHALSLKEKRISIAVGACLAFSLGCVLYSALASASDYLVHALAYAFIMIPCSSLSNLSKKWKLVAISIFSAALFLATTFSAIANEWDRDLSGMIGVAVIIVAGLYSWVSSALSDD